MAADPGQSPTDGPEVRRRGVVWVVLIAVGVLVLDQTTKWLAVQELAGQPPVQVIGDWLRLTFVRNPGGAFSIGTNLTWLFASVALGVAVAIIVFSRRVTSAWWLVALGLVLGGALGNLIDRVIQPPGFPVGHVVDFLQLPYWPVFNVADMSVVGGALTIVTLTILGVEPARPARVPATTP